METSLTQVLCPWRDYMLFWWGLIYKRCNAPFPALLLLVYMALKAQFLTLLSWKILCHREQEHYVKLSLDGYEAVAFESAGTSSFSSGFLNRHSQLAVRRDCWVGYSAQTLTVVTFWSTKTVLWEAASLLDFCVKSAEAYTSSCPLFGCGPAVQSHPCSHTDL